MPNPEGRPTWFRRALDALEPYAAARSAKDLRQERQASGKPLVALAANECPQGPFPAAKQAAAKALSNTSLYPESGFRSLRRKLADQQEIPVERVVVGAGALAILHHIALAVLEPGDEMAHCTPTFHAYRLEALKMGASVTTAPVGGDGAYDVDALLARVTPQTKLVILCSPNNPTGGIIKRDDLRRFLDALPSHVLPVIDQAYFEYVENDAYPDTIRETEFHGRPLVTLRTFSKIYGIAGLRVGYAVAPEEIVDACHKVQSNYEVNCAALAAASVSLEDDDELKRRRISNRLSKERLTRGLDELGFSPFPSEANFVCLKVGDGAEIARRLEEHGVIVRPLAKMGDKESIRVTVGSDDDVDSFLAAFARLELSTP